MSKKEQQKSALYTKKRKKINVIVGRKKERKKCIKIKRRCSLSCTKKPYCLFSFPKFHLMLCTSENVRRCASYWRTRKIFQTKNKTRNIHNTQKSIIANFPLQVARRAKILIHFPTYPTLKYEKMCMERNKRNSRK